MAFFQKFLDLFGIFKLKKIVFTLCVDMAVDVVGRCHMVTYLCAYACARVHVCARVCACMYN